MGMWMTGAGHQSLEDSNQSRREVAQIHPCSSSTAFRVKIDLQLMNIIQIFGGNFCSLLSTVLTFIIREGCRKKTYFLWSFAKPGGGVGEGSKKAILLF